MAENIFRFDRKNFALLKFKSKKMIFSWNFVIFSPIHLQFKMLAPFSVIINSKSLDRLVYVMCIYMVLIGLLEIITGIVFAINYDNCMGKLVGHSVWLLVSGCTTLLLTPFLYVCYFKENAFVFVKRTGWNPVEFGEAIMYWGIYIWEIVWAVIGSILLWNYFCDQQPIIIVMYISVISYLLVCSFTGLYIFGVLEIIAEPFKRCLVSVGVYDTNLIPHVSKANSKVYGYSGLTYAAF